MNGSQHLQDILRLHHLSTSVLQGTMDHDVFAQQIRTWFETLRRSLPPGVLPGEDTMLNHLEQILLAELALDEILLPALQGGDHDTASDTATAKAVLGLLSASILDTLFQRLAILCEIVGLQDGSVSFPEETYWIYQDLRSRVASNDNETTN